MQYTGPMITALAISNYRSLRSVVMPLGALNLITGPNGSGKSNLYKALRLLAETARGGVIGALAREGGLPSTLWAGPDKITRNMRDGVHKVEGSAHKNGRVKLGFAGEDFGYAISLGMPPRLNSLFNLDPEVKREAIWNGEFYRAGAALVERDGPLLKMRDGRAWRVVTQHVPAQESLFEHVSTDSQAAEAVRLGQRIRGWRFYDHFRSDHDAPARWPQLGTRTPVLHPDGRDLVAALQTIREIGDAEALQRAIEDAFPGGRLETRVHSDGRFELHFIQPGLLRPLSAREVSDGTLRYLLWVAALLTPRPPSLMVLNEPETSLHPELLPALARLIGHAATQTQVWVVSHARPLIEQLSQQPECLHTRLDKSLGETQIGDQDLLTTPHWLWPDGTK